ncbi:MAG: AbrB/MazE/SpoVT family DNA-binding domain-containing protein [Gammaproteobacteria bacterium]|nr:AbrB/MazE/SpoVT family DNA-binding domain-containing protein [Gammaproteobacteria bacterium]
MQTHGPGGSPEPISESLIDARGRTTIPKAVRESLDLRGGDRIRYLVEDGEVRIRPMRSVARLRGIVRHAGPPLSLEDMDRAIGEGARRP